MLLVPEALPKQREPVTTIQIGYGQNIQHGQNYLCYVSVLTFQKGPLTRHNSLNTHISRMCRKSAIHL